ncbi:hypothetical protein AF72_11245 [Xylella taiwanensis]|uniref:Uncharacterized protein n=1 Tax=Xylella taiwanensis TaxID=1444770 RepID=Z9JG06_9GAMM|nr:hypothetical protein AF72_11245 [Xylella taiwanensis]
MALATITATCLLTTQVQETKSHFESKPDESKDVFTHSPGVSHPQRFWQRSP